MAYFNHAFHKLFLGTGVTQKANPSTGEIPQQVAGVTTSLGFLNTAGKNTQVLNDLSAAVKTYYQGQVPTGAPYSVTNYTQGYFGIFDAKTQLSLNAPTSCCNVYFAGSTIYPNDKIGPYHGGYQETNKSKMVNPRYVQKFYRVDPCAPQNEVVHIGSTYGTLGGGVTAGSITTPGTAYAPNTATPVVVNTVTATGTGTGLTLFITVAAGVPTVTGIASLGKGYAVGDTVTILEADGTATSGTAAVYTISAVTTAVAPVLPNTECCKEFLCGETYYLRLDVKGSPALRFLNHNAYYNADAYTGCCPDNVIVPPPVNSTGVMIQWANNLLNYALISPFLQIIIQDEAGVLWYEPGTSAADLAAVGGNTWDNYDPLTAHTTGACAGLIIQGAYVDTKFGDCSFQISDFYEKEPVRIFASEVDLTGDPCEFGGICVAKECEARQAQGLGETVLRDLILSEQYRQNFFSTDIRIREITQGNQMLNVVNRNGLYSKYYLLHNVPRFNNPTGVFDNDRYLLEFVTNGAIAAFETAVNNWLEDCGTECAYEVVSCVETCTPPVDFPPLPFRSQRGKLY